MPHTGNSARLSIQELSQQFSDRLSPRKPGILRSGRDILPYSFYLGKVCTNNAAEYEALIMGLELALKFKIRHIEIFGNAELVIKQMTTEYEVRYEGLAMYHDLAQRLFECFPDASITHVPRKDNAIADAFRNKGKTQLGLKFSYELRAVGLEFYAKSFTRVKTTHTESTTRGNSQSTDLDKLKRRRNRIRDLRFQLS